MNILKVKCFKCNKVSLIGLEGDIEDVDYIQFRCLNPGCTGASGEIVKPKLQDSAKA
jgi:hypothetical protein